MGNSAMMAAATTARALSGRLRRRTCRCEVGSGGTSGRKRAIVSAALAALAIAGMGAAASADDLGVRVYDGDTIAPTVRLTIDGEISFDTPETAKRHGADCDLEIERGKAAGQRLRAIIAAAGEVRLEFLRDFDTGDLARTGDGKRLLARMLIDGENVGHILAREGHAVIYRWRSERVDWCTDEPTVFLKTGTGR